MTHKTWNGCLPFACIFPGLKAWMQRNDWNVSRLADEADLFPNTLSNNLSGRTEMKMYTIRRILEITGLTFEQAFGEVMTPEEARKER